MLVNTPYDDVFKTLAHDCSELLIPVINELFNEHFIGSEKIIFHPNEYFLNQQNGQEQKRITDTFFEILGDRPKKYHLECQSTADSSMLIRMFEYDTQIALDHSTLNNASLTVNFPNSAILYLRSTAHTPDSMQIHMLTPAGQLSYPIPVMKIKNYSLDIIFKKNLLFLIPFYIFTHESLFMVYNTNIDKLQLLLNNYIYIRERLDILNKYNRISEFTKCTIIDMSNKVLEHIAQNYAEIQKGVKSIMGGKILEYEAKTIRNLGLEEGRMQGKVETFLEMVRDGFISIPEAAKRLNISVEEFQILVESKV